jgi:hypothetical protein
MYLFRSPSSESAAATILLILSTGVTSQTGITFCVPRIWIITADKCRVEFWSLSHLWNAWNMSADSFGATAHSDPWPSTVKDSHGPLKKTHFTVFGDLTTPTQDSTRKRRHVQCDPDVIPTHDLYTQTPLLPPKNRLPSRKNRLLR